MGIYKQILNQNAKRAAGLKELCPQEIKELQDCLIKCYSEIFEVCEKYGIKPFLTSGNLLGYIRHNGFIPWDDDLDLGMLRDDYEKFKLIFFKELSNKYIISVPNSSQPAHNRFMQLFRKGTVLKRLFTKPGYPEHVYIDIFPIDYVPEKKIVRFTKGIFCNFLMMVGGCVGGRQNTDDYYKECMKYTARGKMVFWVRNSIGIIFSFYSAAHWFDLVDRHIRWRRESKFVTSATDCKHYFGEIMPYEYYFPLNKSFFVGAPVYIVNNPKKYLSSAYGNYMAVPPEEKRERHFVIELKADI